MRRGHTFQDVEDQTMIDLYFSCRNLADMDFITVTDPFLVVFRKTTQGAYLKCGNL